MKPDLDAQLLAYMHSLPPEAAADVSAAIKLVVSAQRKGSWLRSVIVAGAALIGSGSAAISYLHNLVTKDDLAALGRQYAEVQHDQMSHEEHQDTRIAALEPACSQAQQCCNNQTLRIDRMTTPRSER